MRCFESDRSFTAVRTIRTRCSAFETAAASAFAASFVPASCFFASGSSGIDRRVNAAESSVSSIATQAASQPTSTSRAMPKGSPFCHAPSPFRSANAMKVLRPCER